MAFPSDLPAALSAARAAVERHVGRAEQIGVSWQEETVSELLWVNTHVDGRMPVLVADFNKPEEGKVGADWLWWFVDDTGECFGLLVQAKRLKHDRRGPTLDLRYKRHDAPIDQMTKLYRAAQKLSVPSAYALYFGPVGNRGLQCSATHDASCEPCQKKTISILSGLRAQFIPDDQHVAARQAFQECVALEDLADSTQNQEPAVHIRATPLPDELERWMIEPQVGARQIAKRIYQMIIRPDELMHSAAVADRLAVPVDAVFQDMPLDEAHFGQPYFPHVLRGLRRSLPSYVLDIRAGLSPTIGPEFEDIGGIVVLAV
jgi:hypothetical protein